MQRGCYLRSALFGNGTGHACLPSSKDVRGSFRGRSGQGVSTGAFLDQLIKPLVAGNKAKPLNEGIANFYDESTPLWESMWGEHLHHGYYAKGGKAKSNAQAQIDMIEEVLKWAGVVKVSKMVDVGCGVGGSSRHIARKYKAKATGITLSPVQADRGNEIAATEGLGEDCSFKVADALEQPFDDGSFDLVWSLESGEHMPTKPKFVGELVRVCAPGGRIIIVTWCHRNLLPGEKSLNAEEQSLLDRVCEAYYLPAWCSLHDYEQLFQKEGMQNIKTADWSEEVAPFWGAVIKSAISADGIRGLFKAGWTTIKAEGSDAPTALPVRDPVTNYEKIKRIGEGTYGVVYKARDRTTGEIVALKKILMHKIEEGVPVTAIRELRVLQSCKHPNVVSLKRVVTASKPDSLFMVFEYCEHDLGRLLDTMPRPFTEAEVKCLMKQMLKAIEWLHSRSVMHRDIKLCNLLMTKNGHLKLCDFGLARYTSAYEESYTPGVVTLWYRAPEILMGLDTYCEKVDMWAAGCIMGELLQKNPLFPGRTEISMLDLFTKLLGSPHDVWKDFKNLPYADKIILKKQPYSFLEQKLPSVSPSGLNLLNQLLTYDPNKRISARRALSHPWFKQYPMAVRPESMPKFPSTQDAHESTSKRAALAVLENQDDQDAKFGLIFGDKKASGGKRTRLA